MSLITEEEFKNTTEALDTAIAMLDRIWAGKGYSTLDYYEALCAMKAAREESRPAADKAAIAFSETLREWIGDDKVAEAVRLNRTAKYSGCCATHDFCDANMAMQAAFEKLGLPDPSLLMDDEAPKLDCGLTATELWNAAWDVARAEEFDPERIRKIAR